jgi:hypothetical protein
VLASSSLLLSLFKIVKFFLKWFFLYKYIDLIYFYFLKFIFDINTLKQSKNIKKYYFKIKKNNYFLKNIFEMQKQTNHLYQKKKNDHSCLLIFSILMCDVDFII